MKFTFANLIFQVNRSPKPPLMPDLSKTSYDKVFCIGAHKTGTTSLEFVLRKLGFPMGNQRAGEVLAHELLTNFDYSKIIRFAHSARAFQDTPFAILDVYKALDEAFPNSKFILTTRSSPEEWFESMVRFHAKRKGRTDGSLSTPEEHEASPYVFQGWELDMKKLMNNYPSVQLWDKQAYMVAYESRNHSIREYFQKRPNTLLDLNLTANKGFESLLEFLEIDPCETHMKEFPHLNKSTT